MQSIFLIFEAIKTLDGLMESVAVSALDTQPTCKMVIGLCASFHKVFAIIKPSKDLREEKFEWSHSPCR